MPLTKDELENIIQVAVHKAFEEIKADLRKIEGYLYDDNDTKSPGLVQRVREIESDINKIKEDKRVEKKVHATLGMVGGGLIMALVEFLKWFFTHGNK